MNAFITYYCALTEHNKQALQKQEVLSDRHLSRLPPFEYVASNGSIASINIEFIRHLTKIMEYVSIKIVSIDFDGLILALTVR